MNSTNSVRCKKCGGTNLHVRRYVDRKVKGTDGMFRIIKVKQYICEDCKATMRHLPTNLMPYKQYEPFLSKEPMTLRETLDYIRCMTITQNVDPKVYRLIDDATIAKVNSYIEDSMTATWFNEDNKKKGGKSEQITAEIIYYWMTALQIPPEYQKWHLNRLITLIRVCSIKNQPEKKMSQAETIARHRELNAIRRKQRKMKK